MKKSVAIIPSFPVVEQVYNFKKQLYRKIGWFRSSNSLAHLTVAEFEANERDARVWSSKMEHFCSDRRPFDIHFNKIKVFRNTGTIYVALDDHSAALTKNLMANVHNYTAGLKAVRIYEPHMTIARGLDEVQLRKAFDLFSQVRIDMTFTCNDLCIRKLDEVKLQYELESRHSFKGNPYLILATPQLQMATLF